MNSKRTQVRHSSESPRFSWKTKLAALFTLCTITGGSIWEATPPFAKNVIASWVANQIPVLGRDVSPTMFAATPLPAKAVPIIFGNMFGVQFWCPPRDTRHRIEAFANVHGLRDGQSPWLFARASENQKYYPSARPKRDQGGTYEGTVYVGRGQVFRLYLAVLDAHEQEQVQGYLNGRKTDGDWNIGIDELPDWNPLTHQDVYRSTCNPN